MSRARELSRLIGGNPTTETSEIVLRAVDTDSPQANVFIRYRDADGNTKGFVGFTASGDDTLSMTSLKDHRLKFRTGNVAEDNFLDRVFIHGNGTASWLGIQSQSALGGAFLRFTAQDYSDTKGFFGFASTTDDDIDLINQEDGGHIEVATTGAGVFKVNPPMRLAAGTAAAPTLAFLVDTDTGLLREAANVLGLAVGGTQKVAISAAGLHLGTSASPFFSVGAGTPQGSVTAPIGSVYLNTSGGAATTLYVKTSGSGNTGWTAK